MQYIDLVIVLMFILFITYNNYENKKEKMMLIRELTTSLKSKDIVEYKDNTPEYKDVLIDEKDEDELIPIEDVEPVTLLRAISK
jgi:hypothetical protein